jgi:hypothetical protein
MGSGKGEWRRRSYVREKFHLRKTHKEVFVTISHGNPPEFLEKYFNPF